MESLKQPQSNKKSPYKQHHDILNSEESCLRRFSVNVESAEKLELSYDDTIQDDSLRLIRRFNKNIMKQPLIKQKPFVANPVEVKTVRELKPVKVFERKAEDLSQMIYKKPEKHLSNYPRLKELFSTSKLVELLIERVEIKRVETNKNQHKDNTIVNHYNIVINQTVSKKKEVTNKAKVDI